MCLYLSTAPGNNFCIFKKDWHRSKESTLAILGFCSYHSLVTDHLPYRDLLSLNKHFCKSMTYVIWSRQRLTSRVDKESLLSKAKYSPPSIYFITPDCQRLLIWPFKISEGWRDKAIPNNLPISLHLLRHLGIHH